MFKEYDVRGEYPSVVSDENFYFLGRALQGFGKPLYLGRDFRKSGATLAPHLATGFSEAGGEVIFLGNIPTPATAFLCGEVGTQITASHNPPQYNGAKFFRAGVPFFKEDLAKLKAGFEKAGSANAPKRPIVGLDASGNEGELERYFNALPEFGENALFDLCGGAACGFSRLFKNKIYDVADPLFEKHSAEPKDATLGDLKSKTADGKLLGLAFDGDADRVFAVDRGKVLPGDVLAAFCAQEMFSKGDKITLSIDCQNEFFDFIRDLGLKPVWSGVGDVNVLKTAIENGADFAAEVSGHFSFMKHMAYSDAIYAAAKLSHFKAGSLAEFASQFKNVVVREEVRFSADFEKVKARFSEERGLQSLVTIDGVKAVFEGISILVRASKTEPKIRISSEGKDSGAAKAGVDLAKAVLAECKPA